MPCHPTPAIRSPRAALLGLLAFVAVLALNAPARAVWSNGNWTEVFASNEEIDDFVVASDGNGGTLAMIFDKGIYPFRARYSRLNRAGTEVWGDGGRLAPYNISAQGQARPIAIEADGSSGAFVLWQEWYGTSGVFHLARVDASGAQMWSVDVASAGSESGQAGAELVLEPGIGVTVGFANSSAKRLTARRYDMDGNLLWATDVNQFYHHNIWVAPSGGYTEFDMESDGQGGVLFAWYRYDLAAYQSTTQYFEQIGAQRIDSTGNRLWGLDGHQVWQTPGFWHPNAFNARIVDDGAGGAYVVTSGGSEAYGQHLDASGNETWAANGIVLQDTGAGADNVSTDPQLCRDGVGGFFLMQHSYSIFATRIDINGTPLWGAAGIVVSQAADITEYMASPSIDEDGFGGAVLGYNHWHGGTESVGGARLDSGGNVLWNDKSLYTASGNDGVLEVHVVADGIGGAQFVWKRHVTDTNPLKDDIYALGVDGSGQPVVPLLYGMLPDAGEPGETLPTVIFGDYIDETLGYDLRHGGASTSLTGLGALAPNLVGGWIDLTGAALGAWDLVATNGGSDAGTLVDAFGVGYRPDCTNEWDLERNGVVELFGSRRKMAFDSQGMARTAWILPHANPDQQLVYLGSQNDTGGGSGLVETLSGHPIGDFAFTVDGSDRDVISYVHNGNELISHSYDWDAGGLVPSRTIQVSFGSPIYRPVVRCTPDGVARTVFELDDLGTRSLWQAWNAGLGNWVGQIPQTGTNAHDVDIAPSSDGLVMVYVRDSWFPGLSELCLQHLRDETWEAPTVLTFGISLASPSVACDRNGNVLVAWILDNSLGSPAPVLQTVLVENGALGPIRTRATDGTIYRVQADAQGPGHYFLLTQETGQPMQFFVRGGDGRVFYPKQRVNSDDDSDWPSFAVQFGGLRMSATWQAYNTPSYGDALMAWFCQTSVMTAAPETPPTVVPSSVHAVPNPFNPRTQLQFELSSTQWVKVVVFDSRGRRVRTLQDGTLSGGPVSLEFDGRDDRGQPLASGVYFAQVRPSLDAPGVVKLTLLK